jgi:lipoprotein-anchoring transpeptidase ErfK/SrfK
MAENRLIGGRISVIALAVVCAGCVPPAGTPGPANGNNSNGNASNVNRGNSNTANTNAQTSDSGSGVAPASRPQASETVSARSDSVTGGRIERAEVAEGSDVRITINVPAYQLTLWQGGKEVAVWPIAIGRTEYPLPSGSREAEQITLTPDWIPPDSDWVEEVKDVKPGEVVPSADKRNPLGDIKIRLGDDGTLIHEAKTKAELGRPVSHGCARMVESDLVDLVAKIAIAQGLSLTADEIRSTIKTDEKREVKLESSIPVDISYDTAVVEGGTLYLYPDVYKKQTAETMLREELASAGVDAAALDAKTVSALLARPKGAQGFAVSLEDLKAGRAVAAGRTVSLTTAPKASDGKNGKNEKSAKGGQETRGRR